MTKTFDPKCYELAVLFLSDEPMLDSEAAREGVAAAIQEAVEDEIAFMRHMMEKA